MSRESAAAHWRRLIEEREEQTASVQSSQAEAGYWGQCAETFARVSRGFQGDRLFELMQARLKSGATVLDVGAGTGRYTALLANAGARVTAVEPSEAMRGFLEENVTAEGVADRVTIVGSPWEQADVPPADIVLCSHVVYGIKDIVPFLEKLDRHARDAVFLAVRVTQFDANVLDLWPRVYGVERKREPGFIDLYNLLYEMGIVANVETAPFGARRGQGPGGGFGSEEEAVDSVRRILFTGPDERTDALVRAYLAEHMEQRDGRLYWKGRGMRAALVWWTK